MTFTVIVCAFNEERYLPACLRSLLVQSGPADEIIVVNNASTDTTAAVAKVPGVTVIDEPRKGLVIARETGRLAATGDVLMYLDADCRAPREWLERFARFRICRSACGGDRPVRSDVLRTIGRF